MPFEHDGERRASNLVDVLVEEESTGVFNRSESIRTHLEEADFAGGAEAVLDGTGDSE